MVCASIVLLNLGAALAAIHWRLAPNAAIAALVGPSVVTYFLMGWDKLCAYAGRTRVPETALITATLAGGAIGFMLSALFHRHKLRNAKLMLLGLAALITQSALAAVLH